MNYEEVLLTCIQVAVAFAGFSALVTALRNRPADRNPHLAVRLRGMVEVALLVAFFSMLGICIKAFPLPEEVVWRTCSGLLAVTWPSAFLISMSRARRAIRAGFPMGSAPYVVFLYSIVALSAASLAANALDLFSPHSGVVYVTNLGALLLVCGIWFVRLIAGIVPALPSADER